MRVQYELPDVVCPGVLLLDGDEAGGRQQDLPGRSIALDDDLLVLLHLEGLVHVKQVVGHVDDLSQGDGDGPGHRLEEEVVEYLDPGRVVKEDSGPRQGGEGGVGHFDLLHVTAGQLERQRGRQVCHQELRHILHLHIGLVNVLFISRIDELALSELDISSI